MGAGGGYPEALCTGSPRWPPHPGGGLWVRSHLPQPAEPAPRGEPPVYPHPQVGWDRQSWLLLSLREAPEGQ